MAKGSAAFNKNIKRNKAQTKIAAKRQPVLTTQVVGVPVRLNNWLWATMEP